MSNPIVTCHLGLRFRLALEFGLKFSDYEALFMGNMSFSLSGGFRNLEEISKIHIIKLTSPLGSKADFSSFEIMKTENAPSSIQKVIFPSECLKNYTNFGVLICFIQILTSIKAVCDKMLVSGFKPY